MEKFNEDDSYMRIVKEGNGTSNAQHQECNVPKEFNLSDLSSFLSEPIQEQTIANDNETQYMKTCNNMISDSILSSFLFVYFCTEKLERKKLVSKYPHYLPWSDLESRFNDTKRILSQKEIIESWKQVDKDFINDYLQYMDISMNSKQVKQVSKNKLTQQKIQSEQRIQTHQEMLKTVKKHTMTMKLNTVINRNKEYISQLDEQIEQLNAIINEQTDMLQLYQSKCNAAKYLIAVYDAELYVIQIFFEFIMYVYQQLRNIYLIADKESTNEAKYAKEEVLRQQYLCSQKKTFADFVRMRSENRNNPDRVFAIMKFCFLCSDIVPYIRSKHFPSGHYHFSPLSKNLKLHITDNTPLMDCFNIPFQNSDDFMQSLPNINIEPYIIANLSPCFNVGLNFQQIIPPYNSFTTENIYNLNLADSFHNAVQVRQKLNCLNELSVKIHKGNPDTINKMYTSIKLSKCKKIKEQRVGQNLKATGKRNIQQTMPIKKTSTAQNNLFILEDEEITEFDEDAFLAHSDQQQKVDIMKTLHIITNNQLRIFKYIDTLSSNQKDIIDTVNYVSHNNTLSNSNNTSVAKYGRRQGRPSNNNTINFTEKNVALSQNLVLTDKEKQQMLNASTKNNNINRFKMNKTGNKITRQVGAFHK